MAHPHHRSHEGHGDGAPRDHAVGREAGRVFHGDHEAMMADPRMAEEMERDMGRRFWIAFVLSVPVVLYSPLFINVFGVRLPSPIPVNRLLFLLTTPVVLGAGSIFLTGSVHALRGRRLNMSVLIATGVLAAYLFSVVITFTTGGETFYEAAALLVTFVLFGHWMEVKARRGTSDALRALFDLVPPEATVWRDGREVAVPVAEIAAGDIVLLKPGDKVPVDGEVIEGESAVDESLITGESIPVSKKTGDAVVGGSINRSGFLRFKATKVGKDTVLSRIVKLVETAQSSKAPGQRIADRAAAYLVVLAVGAGAVTFAAWFFGAGAPAFTALTFAVSTVVIACPDALGLATPTAVAVGTGIGARHNILIKDAATLERTSRIEAVVLDKTGTLTEGRPVVTDVVPSPGFSPEEVVRWNAAAESRSSHPLSLAVLEEARRRGVEVPEAVEGFEALAGHGVKATVEGRSVLVGTRRLMRDHGVDLAPIQAEIDRLLSDGKTIMIVAVDGRAAGVLAAADPVKATAGRAIEGMRALGLEVAMITGDNRQTAEAVARQLGIERVFAEVLPRDKAGYVKKLQEEGRFVAMVGDGINDAPALAQADIGIAIGAGTDVAIETANVVLMKSDPADILAAIRLSKATVKKMKQNLFWAAIYNVLAIPVAAGAFYNSLGWSLRPEVSAILMSVSSLIVATNALLLKKVDPRLRR